MPSCVSGQRPCPEEPCSHSAVPCIVYACLFITNTVFPLTLAAWVSGAQDCSLGCAGWPQQPAALPVGRHHPGVHHVGCLSTGVRSRAQLDRHCAIWQPQLQLQH